MPFAFDFNNGGALVTAFGSGATLSHTANGVSFTLSGDSGGGKEVLGFGNTGNPSIPLYINDQASADVITLTFQSTVNTANNQLSATASNQLVFSFAHIAGSWKIGPANNRWWHRWNTDG